MVRDIGERRKKKERKEINRNIDYQIMQQMSSVRCICVVLFWCVATIASVNSHPDVVYYEPELHLEYATDIHPYAYAYKLPLPTYDRHHTPKGTMKDFASFLDLQDHIKKGSLQADKLTVSPDIVDSIDQLTTTPSMVEADSDATPIMSPVKFGPKQPDGSPNPDPADPLPVKLDPMPSPFVVGDRHGAGVFGNNYRRAVYGLRRRRMPFTINALTTTLNPWRRPNNFLASPPDMMFPRARFLEAMNPSLTDVGRFGGPGIPAYGGFSSFRALRNQQQQGPYAPLNVLNGGGLPYTVGQIGGAIPNLAGLNNMGAPSGLLPGMNSFQAPHPLSGGPSPYIPGMYDFHDFYGGGGKAGGGGGAEGGEGF